MFPSRNPKPRCDFSPEEDLTAYELAKFLQAIGVISDIFGYDEDRFPEELRKHLKKKEAHAISFSQTAPTSLLEAPEACQEMGKEIRDENPPAEAQVRLWPTVHGDGDIVMDEYDDRLEHAKLLFEMSEAIQGMQRTEAFAYTEDSYTARIPGKTLKNWKSALEKAYFKLNQD